MKTSVMVSGAAALVAVSGMAVAAVTVNGVKDASDAYGAAKWIQTNPTQFGDAGQANPCDPNATGGSPTAVNKGAEYKIPLARLGNPVGAIRLMAFVDNRDHNYASNQFLPPLPIGTGNLGGDGSGGFTGTLSGINLNNFVGDQYVSVTPATASPTVDGTLDASYGTAVAVQTVRTGFGNATNGQQAANGSELDAMYVVKDATFLYVFLAGNIEGGNFNKLELFIDSQAGGQNIITNTNANVDDNNCLNTTFPGFTFDTGFSADFYITFGAGNNPIGFYPHAADLVTLTGGFQGCNLAGNGSGVLNGCGSPPADDLQVALDNSNTGGVDGPCPPPAGNADVANGSEIDAIYAYIDTADQTLNVLVTGNVENSTSSPCDEGGNKLMLFIDADGSANGQPVILNNNVDISYGALNRMAGLRFDPGFAADYFLALKTQGPSATATQVVDAAVLRTAGVRQDPNSAPLPLDFGAYDGNAKSLAAPVSFDGNFSQCNGGFTNFIQQQDGFAVNLFTNYAPRQAQTDSGPASPTTPVGTANLIKAFINNANIGGITGTSGLNGGSVNTGVEYSIKLSELGWDGTSCIKIAGFINNSHGDYLSNQVIGSLPSGYDNNNLGSDMYGNYVANSNFINFAALAGNQYITVNCAQPTTPGCGHGRCVADYDDGSAAGVPDGGVGIEDLLYYLLRYDAGC